MIHSVGDYVLRKPEPSDIEALYRQKNDPVVAAFLGGFSAKGYARSDLSKWLEYHNQKAGEVLRSIAHAETDICVGHVGLYEIDHRIRSAEFAIMIGDRSAWGMGLGTACTRFAIEFGFEQLNLNRIHLTVLATNPRARAIYTKLGFLEEGRMRQAQYKDGAYIDVFVMGLLRDEYRAEGA